MNNDKQHREDTKYVQWQDGMYIMIYELKCDYEKALIEDALRRSVYFKDKDYFKINGSCENKIGVMCGFAGYWITECKGERLTREQALYISTGQPKQFTGKLDNEGNEIYE
jgi:hypothetical protein